MRLVVTDAVLPENGALVLTGSAEGGMPDRVEPQGQMVATVEELNTQELEEGEQIMLAALYQDWEDWVLRESMSS